jgi:hypothetical protein
MPRSCHSVPHSASFRAPTSSPDVLSRIKHPLIATLPAPNKPNASPWARPVEAPCPRLTA